MRELWVNGRRVERWNDTKRTHTAYDVVTGQPVKRRGFNNTERARVVLEAVLNPLRGFLPALRPDGRR